MLFYSLHSRINNDFTEEILYVCKYNMYLLQLYKLLVLLDFYYKKISKFLKKKLGLIVCFN